MKKYHKLVIIGVSLFFIVICFNQLWLFLTNPGYALIALLSIVILICFIPNQSYLDKNSPRIVFLSLFLTLIIFFIDLKIKEDSLTSSLQTENQWNESMLNKLKMNIEKYETTKTDFPSAKFSTNYGMNNLSLISKKFGPVCAEEYAEYMLQIGFLDNMSDSIDLSSLGLYTSPQLDTFHVFYFKNIKNAYKFSLREFKEARQFCSGLFEYEVPTGLDLLKYPNL